MNSSQCMDKQILGLSGSQNDDIFEFLNPQEEHNSGSKKEDILPSYDFQPIRPAGTSQSMNLEGSNVGSTRVWSSADSRTSASADRNYVSLDPNESAKVTPEKDRSAYDAATVSEIDRKMKNLADRLLQALEGVSARLSQLESRTHHLESSVDDLKVSLGNNHGSTDGKLRQLENILREVQTGVQVVKDKQEIAENQFQLAKLQVSRVEQQPENQTTSTQVGLVQQTASAAQQSRQLLPSAASVQQPTQPFPSAASLQQPTQPFPSAASLQQSTQPFPSAASLQQPTQPIPSAASLQQTAPPLTLLPFNAPPPPLANQQNLLPAQLPLQLPQNQLPPDQPQEPYCPPPVQTLDATHPQYQLPPTQQSQPPLQAPHQPYQPTPQPPQYSQLPPPQQPSPVGPVHPPQLQPPVSHHTEEASYIPSQSYPPSIRQPQSMAQPPSGSPPTQQFYGPPAHGYEPPSSKPSSGFPTGYGPTSGPSYNDAYPFGGSPSHYGASVMKSNQHSAPSAPSGGSSYQRLPTAQILPRALPTANSVGGPGSSSSGTGNRVPVDDVVDKVALMGFSRDQVRATVRKLTENGQSVDLNVVLDKLMNDGEVVQPQKGWYGR